MPRSGLACWPAILLALAALSGAIASDAQQCPPEEEEGAASLVQMPLGRSRGQGRGPIAALRTVDQEWYVQRQQCGGFSEMFWGETAREQSP